MLSYVSTGAHAFFKKKKQLEEEENEEEENENAPVEKAAPTLGPRLVHEINYKYHSDGYPFYDTKINLYAGDVWADLSKLFGKGKQNNTMVLLDWPMGLTDADWDKLAYGEVEIVKTLDSVIEIQQKHFKFQFAIFLTEDTVSFFPSLFYEYCLFDVLRDLAGSCFA